MAGALLAVQLGAHQQSRIGPVTVRLAAQPALAGRSRLTIPPFGSVSARTHRGPLQFTGRVEDLDLKALERLIDQDPPNGTLRRGGLAVTLVPLELQAKAAARRLVLLVAGLGLGGGLAAVVVFPRRTLRRAALCGLGGLAATAALLVPTLATYDVGAFRAPSYQGALEYAPALVGDARTGLDRLRTLRQEMTRIGENLDRAYAVLGQPGRQPASDTVRVLHVSDLHLNPAGLDLTERLAERFEVAAVVDTGDMGTWGLPFERSFPQRLASLKVPYLFVKGNHDNAAMVKAVAANPNVRVLDRSVAEVAGIRFYGVGDPTFSPGRGYRTPEFERDKVVRSATVAADLDSLQPPADVLCVHDPNLAAYTAGRVATVLDGHLHAFRTEVRNGTRLLTSGSAGAAGPDGLRAAAPVPYTAEVLYFSPATRRPIAVDRISVRTLESAFAVDRELLSEGGTAFTVQPVEIPADLESQPSRPIQGGAPPSR